MAAKPIKNHGKQWCPRKKSLPSHRLEKLPSSKSKCASGPVARKYFFLHLFDLAWVGFLWFDWIQVRQHQQEDLANKQVRRKIFIIFMMIRTIFMEIYLKNAKQSWQNLCWILKVSWGENIATPPISDVFAFLTKCICNLILCPFFANNPVEDKEIHFPKIFAASSSALLLANILTVK